MLTKVISGLYGGKRAGSFAGRVPREYAANGNLYLGIGSDLSIMLGSLGIPSWNTGGRPSGNFHIGYNTDTSKLELYNGVAWVGITLA